MQRNNKNFDPASILKWEDKIVQTLFQQCKNERLSENERDLYFWLAINRNNIMKVHTYSRYIWTLMFYKNDIETKTPNNKTIWFYPGIDIITS